MAGSVDPRVAAALEHNPHLSALTEGERTAVLRLVELVDHPPGALLAEQGSAGRGLHLLVEGRVEVTVTINGTEHEVALLGPDDVFGESTMLGRLSSSATVRALEPVVAAHVPIERADDLLAVGGLHVQLDALARRRSATNRAIALGPVAVGEVDGRTIGLRPLWPEDWRQLRESLGRISAHSLRMRFFSPPRMTERTLRRLAATDLHDQFAWAASLDGTPVGVGRYALQAEDRGTAELAVLVTDDAQGRGIGTRLVEAIAAAAEVHGADELLALARAENTAVRRLLERFGASWEDAGEDGIVRARWPVATAVAAARHEDVVAAARRLAGIVLRDVVDE